MARKATLILLASVLLVPIGGAAETIPGEGISLHHFQLPCDACHNPQSSDPLQYEDIMPNVGEIKGDINKLCGSSGCHNFDEFLNHPVGVQPKSQIPSSMPLDGNSHITCLTCHSKNESLDEPDYGVAAEERFLYLPEGLEFCGTCHLRMGGTMAEQSHWQFSARAHLGSIMPESTRSASFTQSIGNIDRESHLCLSCHETVNVTIPVLGETRRESMKRWGRMTDHPIAMDYERTAMSKIGKYNYPPANKERIRFFNGKVGCGSCHSPYAQTNNNLVDRNEGGILCRRCHDL